MNLGGSMLEVGNDFIENLAEEDKIEAKFGGYYIVSDTKDLYIVGAKRLPLVNTDNKMLRTFTLNFYEAGLNNKSTLSNAFNLEKDVLYYIVTIYDSCEGGNSYIFNTSDIALAFYQYLMEIRLHVERRLNE